MNEISNDINLKNDKSNFTSITFNLSNKKESIEEVSDEIVGPVDWGLKNHFKYETHDEEPLNDKNVLCFGIGRLAGSSLPGTHRIVFTFRSPLWKGFFFSSMGGTGHKFIKTGLDYVALRNKSQKPTIILLKGQDTEEEPKIDIEYHEINKNNLIDIYKEYKDEEGVYALTQYIIDNFSEKFDNKYRSMVVGPAAMNSNMAGIFSADIKDDEMVPGAEDWAGRGGGGSVMYQSHNVVGIVFGGNLERKFPKTDLSDPNNVQEVLSGHFDKPYNKVIQEKTTKYRYNENLESGGTFGGNYPSLGEFTPIFNWNMPYMSLDERISVHEEIMENYWEPFNEEAIETRNWTNCGEPCPVVCKKYREGEHVDYEPYEAGGPLSGSFEIHKSDISVHKIDSMGFDAIDFGSLSSWVFELISEDLLMKEEVGLSKEPKFALEDFDFEEDSEKNAKLVAELAENIAYGENELCKLLGKGKRKAAQKMDQRFSERLEQDLSHNYDSYKDFAVYVPFGDEGEISPTMYWAIGNFVPIPIQGKYFTFYQYGVFYDPEKLADKCYEKAINEMYSENIGMCRFHRKWATDVIPTLLDESWGIKIDDEHNKEIFQRIVEYDKKAGIKPSYWDSKKVIDLISYGAGEFGNNTWWDEFKKNKEKTAKEYWQNFLESYEDLLEIDWEM